MYNFDVMKWVIQIPRGGFFEVLQQLRVQYNIIFTSEKKRLYHSFKKVKSTFDYLGIELASQKSVSTI